MHLKHIFLRVYCFATLVNFIKFIKLVQYIWYDLL
nr:MAG TPA: hypothetical protein [Caudoviricetes sp.]